MTEKYDLPPYVLSRVRYYDGEFLKDEDFIDDQKFHMDRHRRHERLMHVAGIAEGLDISVVPDATGTRLKVSAGTALDSLGRQILLSTDRLIDIKPEWTATSGSVWTMTIRFNEKEDHPSDANSTVQGNTRFTQEPIIDVVVDAASIQAQRPVVLGQVRFVTGQLPAVLGARAFAGVRLPGPGATSFSLQVTEERGAAKPLTLGLKGSLTIGPGTNGTLNVRHINGKHYESDEPDPLFLNVKNRQPVHIGSKDDPAGLEVSGRVASTGLKVTGDATISGILSTGGSVGIGTPNPIGPLDVVIPGAVPGWDRFVVTANADWGDGTNKYVTLGTGAAGIMLSNVHIPWHKDDGRSSIRYGRSGGVKSGAYWDVGARADNAFSLSYDGHTDHKLWLSSNGNVGIGTSDPKARLHVSGGDVAFTGNLTVGYGQNGDITVRHINGKRWDNNNHDVLALNHMTGHFVVVGSAEKNSGIHIFGSTYTSGQVIVGKGGWSTLHTRHIDGKSHLNDGPDVLYLNSGNQKPVQIGQPGALSSLAVYGAASISGTLSSNGNVGIGTTEPAARLSVVNPHTSQLGGTVRSNALLVSAGSLGTTAGQELALASFGFLSNNSSFLGIRAYRTHHGDGWTTSSIGLGMDVDNTIRAGASIWLGAHGNVGINMATPRAPLHIGPCVDSGIRLDEANTGRSLRIYYESHNSGTVVFYHYNVVDQILGGAFMRMTGGMQTFSDVSLKENLFELRGILDKVMKLRPVSFDWKTSQNQDIGLVAQDVEPIFPELVSSVSVEEGKRTLKGLSYSGLSVLAIAALQEMKTAYDARLKSLEAQLHTLSTRLTQ